MNTKKTIAFFAIAMAVAFVATVGMASAALLPVTKTLYADQSIPVGTVTVSDTGGVITITYETSTYDTTTDDWVLNATHLHVATDLGAIPQTKKNNPIPGKFDDSVKHDPPVNQYLYTTNIPIPTATTTLYIAAQAKVALLVGEVYVQEESAWAGTEVGKIQFDGSNWATYFTIEYLDLNSKDPGTWQPIAGMSGILGYNPSGPTFDFVFDGQGLDLSTEYSLIYYADKPDRYVNWGGNNPGALIATGASDNAGDIHLEGSIELDMDLPCEPDANMDLSEHDYSGAPDSYTHATGAKIWLVPSSDYVEPAMIAWNPTDYLFESDLIWYDDTEEDSCGWP